MTCVGVNLEAFKHLTLITAQNRKEEDMLKRRNIDIPAEDESSSNVQSLNSFTSDSLKQLVLVSQKLTNMGWI